MFAYRRNILKFVQEVIIFQNFIKILFLFVTAIYTFYKLLNCKPKTKYIQTTLLLFAVILSISITILFNNFQTLIPFVMFFTFLLMMKLIEKQKFFLTSITVLFSFSFSFIISSLSILIISLILLPFYGQNYNIPWSIIHIFIGSLQFFLIHCCFHIPRLKKGMNFLYNIHSGNIASTLCTIIIMLVIMANQLKNRTDLFSLIFFSFILICGFLLIYWWNYHITQTYRRFLRKNELDSLNLLLEERNQQIQYLKAENDKLARIIHKDNKIIPALSMAILDSYENKTELDLSNLENDSTLYVKLKQLYDERTETLEKYQQEILHLPQTAFDSVNAILSYMQSEALNASIPYQVVIFDNLYSTIPAEIEENDFTHILGDLLANAINACKDTPSASIQVYLGKMEGISTIKVSNTGNVFNSETLQNLGITRHTTHAETGGSGIGLMDIWKIKQKYTATLLIDETIGTDSLSTYTSVNILFNHKNHYIIQSNRHKELSASINRPDIMILSKD